jgi:hypothetical protein
MALDRTGCGGERGGMQSLAKRALRFTGNVVVGIAFMIVWLGSMTVLGVLIM